MLLKILPTAGPNMARIMITARATSNMINEYSKNPWPVSDRRNSIVDHLLGCDGIVTFREEDSPLVFHLYYDSTKPVCT